MWIPAGAAFLFAGKHGDGSLSQVLAQPVLTRQEIPQRALGHRRPSLVVGSEIAPDAPELRQRPPKRGIDRPELLVERPIDFSKLLRKPFGSLMRSFGRVE